LFFQRDISGYEYFKHLIKKIYELKVNITKIY